MKLTHEADVEVFVECDECGADLVAEQIGNKMIVRVKPCKACLMVAEDRGEEQSKYDRG